MTRPSGILIDPANGGDYTNMCARLYKALIEGDWDVARGLIDTNRRINGESLLGCAITQKYETALHIAVSAKNSHAMEEYIENLVDDMTNEELALQNIRGNTALSLAAMSGNDNIARYMVNRNVLLLDIRGYNERTPLFTACLYGKRKIAQYLYERSNQMIRGRDVNDQRLIFELCVEHDLFDLALRMFREIPALATHGNVLRILAVKTDALRGIKRNRIFRFFRRIFAFFRVNIGPAERPSDAMQLLTGIWRNIVERLSEDTILGILKYPKRVLFVAAEMGNTEYVVQLIGRYPDLIPMLNDDNQSIFHVAVSHRQKGVFNLLYEIGLRKGYLTHLANHSEGNNMLHLAAKRTIIKQVPQDASGVAQQLQKELSWFKEVEAMVPAPYRQKKNKKGLTPYELFTEEHKEQVSEGEKWMKDTAGQSLVVAALIATAVFAATNTVPGGYNDAGFPILLNKQSFKVFVMSDAISLTLAYISILIFLSVLTSHFLEQDFSTFLPSRIMIGLVTLFLSVSAMLVSFCSRSFLHQQNNDTWIPITTSIMAGIAVVLYLILLSAPLRVGCDLKYGSKNRSKLRDFNVDQIPRDEVGRIGDPPPNADLV